jgi:glyoxylase-like metal-dependent hydrolase (beta-lactamase superfamily II)
MAAMSSPIPILINPVFIAISRVALTRVSAPPAWISMLSHDFAPRKSLVSGPQLDSEAVDAEERHPPIALAASEARTRHSNNARPCVFPFKLHVVPVTPFAQNCAILVDNATNKAAVIDPGGDVARIEAAIGETGATVEKILLTHGHIDHAGGAAELAEKLRVPIEGPHKGDEFLLANLAAQGRTFGINARAVTPDRYLEEGQTVKIGDLTFDVLHCPGHTPGSVCYVWHRAADATPPGKIGGFAIVGDVLFQGSVGRTDLPFGSHAQLIDAIKTKLLPLGDDVAFLSGHGPMSTIGAERLNNPFIAD